MPAIGAREMEADGAGLCVSRKGSVAAKPKGEPVTDIPAAIRERRHWLATQTVYVRNYRNIGAKSKVVIVPDNLPAIRQWFA